MALSYYVNNFVHTLWDDKTEKPLLDIFQGVACVEDSTGKIKFISRIDDSLWGAVKGLDLEADDAEEAVIKALGRTAKDTTVVIARKGQFFFPGFIGEIAWEVGCNPIGALLTSLSGRYTYPRMPIPQQWALWAEGPSRLAPGVYIPHRATSLRPISRETGLQPLHQ